MKLRHVSYAVGFKGNVLHSVFGVQRNGILRLVKLVFVDTSVFLRCCYAFILPILEYSSPVRWSADECHLLLLDRLLCSEARLCHDQSFLSLCHRRHVIVVYMLYKVNSNSDHCLFRELSSASTGINKPKLLPQIVC